MGVSGGGSGDMNMGRVMEGWGYQGGQGTWTWARLWGGVWFSGGSRRVRGEDMDISYKYT